MNNFPAISVSHLNHSYSEGGFKKQTLFDINWEHPLLEDIQNMGEWKKR
jgi:hypothetical protein